MVEGRKRVRERFRAEPAPACSREFDALISQCVMVGARPSSLQHEVSLEENSESKEEMR